MLHMMRSGRSYVVCAGQIFRLQKRQQRRILFSSTSGSGSDVSARKTVTIRWKLKDGSIKETPATVGASLLNVAHRHAIDLEGACGGVTACSTCHVILESSVMDALPEPTEEEDDMLDLAFGLTPTSRLGCQVFISEEHDGILVSLPKATRNFYVDGHVPQPH